MSVFLNHILTEYFVFVFQMNCFKMKGDMFYPCYFASYMAINHKFHIKLNRIKLPSVIWVSSLIWIRGIFTCVCECVSVCVCVLHLRSRENLRFSRIKQHNNSGVPGVQTGSRERPRLRHRCVYSEERGCVCVWLWRWWARGGGVAVGGLPSSLANTPPPPGPGFLHSTADSSSYTSRQQRKDACCRCTAEMTMRTEDWLSHHQRWFWQYQISALPPKSGCWGPP